MITAKEFAAMLNGREYHNELTQEESDIAKINQLVVVYGASDDLMEFEGAIDHEIDCYEGTTVYLNRDGIIGTVDNDDTCNYKPHCEFYQNAIKSAKWIKGIWGEGGYDWHYETDISHETFEILEEGDKYCKGIVFSLDSLKEDSGKISDGYHTFEELYYHRMILFSIICNQNSALAWKSKLHCDGSMYPGYFIVGITTPAGDYTYHYELKYWERFIVRAIESAPEWDGHQPEDITRLYSLL
jgi:hypothetical protein